MEKKEYVIIGAGGHAKIVFDVLRQNKNEVLGFTDVSYVPGQHCMGSPVLGTDDSLPSLRESGYCLAAMGIGHVENAGVRNRAFRLACDLGFQFPVLKHPSAVVADSVIMGEGTLIGAMAVVNPETKIGRLCIINSSAVVEHEVVLNDGVHIAPHATVLGNAVIGQNTLIGAGSTILQGLHIGSDCVIGAGSVVLQDIPDHCVVVGTPGKIIKRRT